MLRCLDNGGEQPGGCWMGGKRKDRWRERHHVSSRGCQPPVRQDDEGCDKPRGGRVEHPHGLLGCHVVSTAAWSTGAASVRGRRTSNMLTTSPVEGTAMRSPGDQARTQAQRDGKPFLLTGEDSRRCCPAGDRAETESGRQLDNPSIVRPEHLA